MRGLRKSWPATSRFVPPLGDELRDVHLLRGEVVERARVALAGGLAAGAQLAARALGPQRGAERLEALERGAQVGPRPRAAAQAAQELAEGELGARALERAPARSCIASAAVNRRSASSGSSASSARQCRATACPHGARLLSAHGSKASSHAVARLGLAGAHRRLDAVQRVPVDARRRGQRACVRRGRPRGRPSPSSSTASAHVAADADVDQPPRGRELEALGGERAAAFLLAAHGGEQRLDRDQVGGDLVLARAAGELEPFGQARGGRRPVALPDVAERHPRQRLGEQADHPVLAGARRDAAVQARARRGRRTGRGRPG